MSSTSLDAATQQQEILRLRFELKAARSEITKMHRQMNALAKTVRRELAATRRAALEASSSSSSSSGGTAAPPAVRSLSAAPNSSGSTTMAPIGHIESCFVERNGTPRQPGLAPAARSRLRLRWGTSPEHTLDGLAHFSHVWLVFLFHRNRGDEVVKAKVCPPRLGGERTGIFACRTPHRPNPIGLSLVALHAVEHDTLVLSGADLIDGTPILDVKPFLPYADAPPLGQQVRTPAWVDAGNVPRLRVIFTAEARRDLCAACETLAPADAAMGDEDKQSTLARSGTPDVVDGTTDAAATVDEGEAPTSEEAREATAAKPAPRAALRFFAGRAAEAEAALEQLLAADPRSVYRKAKCQGQEYRVLLDGIEAVCRFGEGADGKGSVTVMSAHIFRGTGDQHHGAPERVE
jgi:tRNA-Thr(GGU) m(6)t(6)A37 methyltransferase TsaA